MTGVGRAEIIADQHVRIRPGAVGAPDLLTGVDVVCGYKATHTELTAADTGDDLILDNQRRGGNGHALSRVAPASPSRSLCRSRHR